MAEIDRPKDVEDDTPAPRWGRLAFLVIGGSILGNVGWLFSAAALVFWAAIAALVIGGSVLWFVRRALGLHHRSD